MTAVFLKILNLSITAGWVVLAVLLLRLIFKKAPKYVHCLFWIIVGIRLIVPFSIESPLSLIPTAEPIDKTVIGSGVLNSDVGVSGDLMASQGQQIIDSASRRADIAEILSIIWIVGVALMLIYMAVSFLLIRRRVAASVKFQDVWICDSIQTPFVLGFLKPRIYLPSIMNKNQIKHVLAHERAHIKRGDYLWKPISFMILSVYWFNPLLWAGYILLCRDIELACDEKVASSLEEAEIIGYSETLLCFGVTRVKIAACPLAFGEVSIKARVKNVLNYKKPAFWIIAASLVLGIAAAVCLLTVRPVKESIAALFHEHEYTSEITKDATCIENGTMTYTCNECGDYYTEETPKTEHEYAEAISRETSCAIDGEVVYTCNICNDSYSETVERIEHVYVSEITTKATCAAKGVLTYTCSACGDSYMEETDYDTAAHSFNYNAVNTVKNATCTENGIIEYSCTLCGEKETKTVDATGHTYQLLSACCVHEGYAVFECSVCKSTEKRMQGAPAHNWTEATCTEPATCRDCGLKGEKLWHMTYGGYCDRCNQNIPYFMITSVEGLDMTLLQDDDLFYFSNPRVDYTVEKVRPYIFFTLTSTIEENTKIFYKITVINERTGEVLHNAGGTSFDRIDPGETKESGAVVNFVLSFDEPGEYRVIFSAAPYCNERVD